jgi:hypothetical protein
MYRIARRIEREVGHLLLDQSFLAGVGNYLRSEILFWPACTGGCGRPTSIRRNFGAWPQRPAR